MKKLMMMAVAMVAVATAVVAEEAKVAAPAAAAPAVVKKEEAPNTGLSFATTLDVYSAYVWRGEVINDRPVWQPGATASYATGNYGTLSANVWGNFDMTDRNDHKKFGGVSEFDYTASYAIDVGPVSLSAGHIWYTFPSVTDSAYGESTREIFVTAQYNNNIVNPFVKAYYDYALVKGTYVNLGLNKTIKLNDRVAVGSEVSLGVGDGNVMSGYYGTDEDAGLADFNAALFATFSITDHITVGPRLAWMSLLDKGARDASASAGVYDDTDILWGGVNLAASF